jgi:ligand-binding sensor domain-containing protein
MMKRLLTIVILFTQLSVFAQQHQVKYRIRESFSPANDINAIRFDSKGELWVGTSFGLYKKEQGRWVLYGAEDVYIQALLIDKRDKKWIGLWGEGVHASQDGNKWETVNAAAPFGSTNAIAADNDGNIWVGDFSSGILRSVKNKWINYKSDSVMLGDNSVLSILVDHHGYLWFGTYHGVSVFDGKVWRLYNKSNSQLPDNNVYALLTDAKGGIWMGTCKGLARLSGGSWALYNTENSGLSSDLILSLGIAPNGDIWVGTDKGVNVFNGKDWKQFNVENSNLIDNRVQVITSYKNATYVGTSKGITVFK